MRLLHQAPPVVMNRKKITRLMKKFGLKCPIRKANPYRRIGRAMQTNKVAPNLLNREFRARGARTVLLTDITYIPRYNSHGNEARFTYLVVIMDAFTKEILAHVSSLDIKLDFVLMAVRQLMDKFGSELKTDCLIHSDQGCHYTSHKFVEIIESERLRQSMSRRGCCWDNAPQESLFGHMKQEIHINPSDCHSIISAKIDDWVDYYNNDRYQWRLAKLSPAQFYKYTLSGDYPLEGLADEPDDTS